MYEICNASYIELDFHFTYELCSVPIIIGVIYATRTMGAVRIAKYKEENCMILTGNIAENILKGAKMLDFTKRLIKKNEKNVFI